MQRISYKSPEMTWDTLKHLPEIRLDITLSSGFIHLCSNVTQEEIWKTADYYTCLYHLFNNLTEEKVVSSEFSAFIKKHYELELNFEEIRKGLDEDMLLYWQYCEDGAFWFASQGQRMYEHCFGSHGPKVTKEIITSFPTDPGAQMYSPFCNQEMKGILQYYLDQSPD